MVLVSLCSKVHSKQDPYWTSEKPNLWGPGTALEQQVLFYGRRKISFWWASVKKKKFFLSLLFVFLDKRQKRERKKRPSLPLSLSEETSWSTGGWAAGVEVLWTDFSEQVLAFVELSSPLWICTPTSDTNSAKQLHLSPTFCVFLLFSSCFVCIHKKLLILFAYTISSSTKRKNSGPQ